MATNLLGVHLDSQQMTNVRCNDSRDSAVPEEDFAMVATAYDAQVVAKSELHSISELWAADVDLDLLAAFPFSLESFLADENLVPICKASICSKIKTKFFVGSWFFIYVNPTTFEILNEDQTPLSMRVGMSCSQDQEMVHQLAVEKQLMVFECRNVEITETEKTCKELETERVLNSETSEKTKQHLFSFSLVGAPDATSEDAKLKANKIVKELFRRELSESDTRPEIPLSPQLKTLLQSVSIAREMCVVL